MLPSDTRAATAHLYERLRQRASAHSVPGSLPILFFGNPYSARIATLGINPSHQEYLDQGGQPLIGDAARFETLSSLHASARAALTDEQCDQAINVMQHYFRPGKPVFQQWFRSLDLVTQAMGYSYARGEVVSLDLVQEATTLTWSALEDQFPNEVSALLAADLPFLRWQVETFPLRAVVCNGMTPLRRVCSLLDHPADVESIARGRLALVKWYATWGHIGGRQLAIVGWNRPLARPTGLTTALKEELGRQIALALRDFEAIPEETSA